MSTRIVNLEYRGAFIGEVVISHKEWQDYPATIPQPAIDRIFEAFSDDEDWDGDIDFAQVRLTAFH